MKPIRLAKLNERYSAVYMPENRCTPYAIVANFNPNGHDDDWWENALGYYADYGRFCRACTNFTLTVGYDRLEEIASKAIDGLIKDDPYEAEEYLRNEIEITDEEVEYFGITETMDMVKRYEEEDDGYVDEDGKI